MKLVVESKETGTVWELEIDADRKTINELLASEDWAENIESEYLSEDWIRKSKGFEVFGYDDDEISEIMYEVKVFFEEHGLDTEEVEMLTSESDDPDVLNEEIDFPDVEYDDESYLDPEDEDEDEDE